MSRSLPVLARTKTKLLLAGVAAVAAFALLGASQARADIAGPASGDGVQPTLVAGNPTCADLNPSWTGWSTESWDVSAVNGPHSVNGGTITILNATEFLFDWSSTFGIDAVIVKAGTVGADSYVYNPEDFGDTGLHAPAKDDGTLRDISHAKFCYDNGVVPPAAALTADKTAVGSFDRTYGWTIQKDVDKTKVTGQVGGTATFNYTVTVTHDSGTGDNWLVKGTITVTNPNAAAVNDVDVSDAIAGDAACTIDGGEGSDETIPANGSSGFDYTCTYNSEPEGTDTNTATVAWPAQTLSNGSSLTAGSVQPTADVDWSTVSPNEIDECVDVSDKVDGVDAGSLGTVCVGDDNPTEIQFSLDFVIPDGCVTHTNEASFTTNDTKATGSDSQTVEVCGVFFGKTMGFWGNKNGQALLTANAAFDSANAVELGGSPGCYIKVDSANKSKTILPNQLNGTSLISACNAASKLDSGINLNSLNVLLGQTLALSYNILYIDNYAGQTVADLGCGSSTDTVEEVRDAANLLIQNAQRNNGTSTITQGQIGAMNTLLGCLNREA